MLLCKFKGIKCTRTKWDKEIFFSVNMEYFDKHYYLKLFFTFKEECSYDKENTISMLW